MVVYTSLAKVRIPPRPRDQQHFYRTEPKASRVDELREMICDRVIPAPVQMEDGVWM